MTAINKKFPLHYQILIALVVGFFFGYFLPGWTAYTNWAGVVFLRFLNMIVIPLILCSIILGVSSLDKGESMGRLTLKTLLFYLVTTMLAILTGFILITWIKPGVGLPLNLPENNAGLNTSAEKIGDLLVNIVPKNIFESLANAQLLPIIFFAFSFGYFMTKVKAEQQNVLRNFFDSILEVIMKVTVFVIKLAPYGVFSIAAKEIARQVELGNNVSDLVQRLGLYMLIVVVGILFHGLVTLSLILRFVAKVNPVKHLKNMLTPLVTAFSTSSTNATLPLTIKAVEENDGVSKKIVGFTIPLGATINMNGTALYECVAVLFIAQIYGIHLTIIQQALVVFTSLLAAVGAAGIPMAGIVMMVIILRTVGLPLEGIGLILPVDRILDMFRTTLNTYGDTCAAVVIAKSEGEKLKI
ncbi:MAG TPA: dicarboxylate/amino acid:cation symporter [Bacteroidales bacterium]|nr:dicarboxylate/amino acid:cation symporter [Bacteroidales bacterium]